MTITAIIIGYVANKIFLYQLCSTLLTFTIIRLYLFLRTRQRRYKLFKYYNIPGPEPILAGGNFNLYRQSDSSYKVDECFLKSYGKIYGVFIGDNPTIVITDLQVLRKVFFECNKSFTERTEMFVRSTLYHSLLFAPYHRWKLMRKAMSSSFSSFQMRGDESVQFIEDSIKLMIDYIENKISNDTETAGQNVEKGNNKIELDIQDLMKAVALHMISNMAIKLPNILVEENESHVQSLDRFLSRADKGVIEYAIRYPFIKDALAFIATHFEYDKTVALIHKGLNKIIDDELKKFASKDVQQVSNRDHEQSMTKGQEKLIDHMIKLHHQGVMTRIEVIANADAVLFAGYDTISTTLTYVLWVLGKHPQIQQRLREELMTYGSESTYLDQVINETMRLYPTVVSFATRLATETIQINDDLTIPKGAKVVYNSWLMHRNPEIWPDPLKFDPDRFELSRASALHPCAFAPFGLGDRKCLGISLAKLEMKLIVCDLLLRYQIRLISPLDELDLVSYAEVLTKPREKVIIEIERIEKQ